MTGSPVPLTVSDGSCERNDQSTSPDFEFRAKSSPAEFLAITLAASITALDNISPPIFFSQRMFEFQDL
jgi:hypothetical protein